MTDYRHLDTLIDEIEGDFALKLVEEFCKLVRDPEIATATYASKIRFLMDEQLQADDAPN